MQLVRKQHERAIQMEEEKSEDHQPVSLKALAQRHDRESGNSAPKDIRRIVNERQGIINPRDKIRIWEELEKEMKGEIKAELEKEHNDLEEEMGIFNSPRVNTEELEF